MSEAFWGLSPTAWIAVLTAVLTVATIFQAVIYGFNLWTSHRVERAYVTMSHYPPGVEFGYDESSGNEPFRRALNVKIKVSNTGNTPATVTRILLHPVVAIEPLPAAPRYDESFGEAVNAFLVKGDHFDFSKEGLSVLSSDATTVRSVINSVAATKYPLRLFVIGYVDYIDRFRVRRRAGYARVYDMWSDSKARVETEMGISGVSGSVPQALREEFNRRYASRNNLLFLTQPGYNYDRKREEDEGNDWRLLSE